MRPDDIKHFLIVYDIPSAHAEVRPYGTDYDAALAAYERAERDTRWRTDVEVVLLGADSLETIKHTHSSYFGSREAFEALLTAGLRAALIPSTEAHADRPRQRVAVRCPMARNTNSAEWRGDGPRDRPGHRGQRKINLMLDEELVHRVRQQDSPAASKSDSQVVEDALTVYTRSEDAAKSRRELRAMLDRWAQADDGLNEDEAHPRRCLVEVYDHEQPAAGAASRLITDAKPG